MTSHQHGAFSTETGTGNGLTGPAQTAKYRVSGLHSLSSMSSGSTSEEQKQQMLAAMIATSTKTTLYQEATFVSSPSSSPTEYSISKELSTATDDFDVASNDSGSGERFATAFPSFTAEQKSHKEVQLSHPATAGRTDSGVSPYGCDDAHVTSTSIAANDDVGSYPSTMHAMEVDEDDADDEAALDAEIAYQERVREDLLAEMAASRDMMAGSLHLFALMQQQLAASNDNY